MKNNLNSFKTKLENNFKFNLNHNQWVDLSRLIFEITIRDNISQSKILEEIKKIPNIENFSPKHKFSAIKSLLISLRFPLSSNKSQLNTDKVFSFPLQNPIENNFQTKETFTPEKVLYEKGSQKSKILKTIKENFPKTNITEIKSVKDYTKKNKFKLNELKKPILFIINEKWDFLKPCPCTKDHIGCNYYILNLGFGCPFDCSYCYLQQYSNIAGILLPSNLDIFFTNFDKFYKKINKPIRIGTGEFCDSLALDNITNYSVDLINFFREKKVFFELKTKSVNIKNLLKISPAKNIIISWSLNPQEIIKTEELSTPSLEQRLLAARKIQNHGYSISFHFDPIIYGENWQAEYKKVIDKMYKILNPRFTWISLGTLRGTRRLKTVVEQRFSQSKIFYGELFLGEDKKLRYPQFLRNKIYKLMIEWIHKHDKKTPVYLCMENKESWERINTSIKTTKQVENYIISKNL